MDNGGMPDDWKPTPPPDIGTLKWKRDVIESSLEDRYSKYCSRAWGFGDIGIFVSIYSGHGWSGYWINPDNFIKAPKINWNELVKLGINGS